MNKQALTEKQEAFALKVVELDNLSEAYRSAYNVGSMSANAISVEASRLMRNPKVSLRVEEIREKNAKRHRITVDTITEMLKEDRELAKELGNPSASVSAAMGLAKLHGLITDKVKATVYRGTDDLTDAELAAIAAGRGARASEAPSCSEESDRLH